MTNRIVEPVNEIGKKDPPNRIVRTGVGKEDPPKSGGEVIAGPVCISTFAKHGNPDVRSGHVCQDQ